MFDALTRAIREHAAAIKAQTAVDDKMVEAVTAQTAVEQKLVDILVLMNKPEVLGVTIEPGEPTTKP